MLDWHILVGVVSGIVQISAIVPYIRDMLRGTTRPNIVSWALWTLIQVIAIAAQLSAGASWSIILLFAMTFNTSLVTILGLIGYGYKKYSWLDWGCLVLAILAIVLWQITNQPLIALVLAIVADLIIAIPTIAKTYREPFTETPSSWFLLTVAAALSIVSTTIYDASNLAFQTYLVLVNMLVWSLAFFGQRIKNISGKTF